MKFGIKVKLTLNSETESGIEICLIPNFETESEIKVCVIPNIYWDFGFFRNKFNKRIKSLQLWFRMIMKNYHSMIYILFINIIHTFSFILFTFILRLF